MRFGTNHQVISTYPSLPFPPFFPALVLSWPFPPAPPDPGRSKNRAPTYSSARTPNRIYRRARTIPAGASRTGYHGSLGLCAYK
jgi:hypothetical protein